MTQPNYALVTGASRGLGKVFARALAARKHNLVLVARSKGDLEALARELSNTGAILVEPLAFDLASPMAGQRLAEQLRGRELRIDLLVNNAGFGVRGRFAELPLERQLEMIYLNSQAIVELTFHLLKPMMEQRHGAIINISSAAGFQPIPYAALYAATKSFLTSFSLALEQELQSSGVKVVTVCPGRIRAASQAEGSKNAKRKAPGLYLSPEAVVSDTLSVLDRGGGLVVPGLVNKFTLVAQRLIPLRTVPKLVAKLSRP